MFGGDSLTVVHILILTAYAKNTLKTIYSWSPNSLLNVWQPHLHLPHPRYKSQNYIKPNTEDVKSIIAFQTIFPVQLYTTLSPCTTACPPLQHTWQDGDFTALDIALLAPTVQTPSHALHTTLAAGHPSLAAAHESYAIERCPPRMPMRRGRNFLLASRARIKRESFTKERKAIFGNRES